MTETELERRVRHYLEEVLVDLLGERRVGTEKRGHRVVAHGAGGHFLDEGTDEDRDWVLEMSLDGLAALRATGLISDRLADEWRENFEEAWHPPVGEDEVAPDGELRGRARRVLGEALGRIESVRAGSEERGPALFFMAALDMARATEVIDADEHRDWWLRHMDALSPGAAAELESVPVGGNVAIWDPPDESDTEEQRAQREREEDDWAFTPAELERVVLAPPERRSGVRLTVVSLYANAVVIHWHLLYKRGTDAGEETSGEHFRAFRRAVDELMPQLVVRDEVGNEYPPVGRPSGGGPGGMPGDSGPAVLWGKSTFRGRVPGTARNLDVRAGDDVWLVELSPHM